MKAWTQLLEPGPAIATLCIVLAVISPTYTAPTVPEANAEQSTEIEYYPVADATGCYYNFQHYDEGDRIITNEPCLNCTCHNRMLMCYLRVCPFTKAIGANCKVEKRADQCCPVITCPEVPVQLVTSTAPSTALGHLNEYGCSIDGLFYSDGARVPSNPENPCELCYCIRNKTACVMQECTLNVEDCRPVYQEGVCCPVRYNCVHPDYLEGPTTPQITTTSSTTTTTEAPTTTLQPEIQCQFNGETYNNGELVKKDIPCEKCYCMRGDIVCAVQECGPTPLDKVNCTALPVREGQCCPDTYDCAGVIEEELTTLSSVSYETEPTTQAAAQETETPATEQPLTTAHITLDERLHEVPETVTKSADEVTTQAEVEKQTEAEEPITPQIIEAATKLAPETPQPAAHVTPPTEPEVTTPIEIQGTTEPSRTEEAVTKVVTEIPSTEQEPVTIVTAITPDESASPQSVSTEEADVSKTTESPVEAFTTRVTEAIEAITSKVTEAVGAITTAITGTTEKSLPEEGIVEEATTQSEGLKTEELVTKVTAIEKEEEEEEVTLAPTIVTSTEPSSEAPESDKVGVTPAISEKEKPEEPTAESEKPVGTEPTRPETEKEGEEAELPKTTPVTVEFTTVAEDTHEVSHDADTIDFESEQPTVETEPPSEATKPPLGKETTLPPSAESEVTEATAIETSPSSPASPEVQTTEEIQPTVTEKVIIPEHCGEEGCVRIPAHTTEISAELSTAEAPTKVTEQPEVDHKPVTILPEIPEPQRTTSLPEIPQTEKVSTEQSSIEGQPPTEAVPAESPTTTESEEIVIITEIPTRKTELPESMDHVSEIAYETESPKEKATAATATEATLPPTTLPTEKKPDEKSGPSEASGGETKQPSVQTQQPTRPETEVTRPFEEAQTPQVSAATTEFPREEENEIEHDEVEPTGPKVEEAVTIAPKLQEETTGKVEELTSAQPITEKAIVPEVCTSEVECAPGVVPSVPAEQPTEQPAETTEEIGEPAVAEKTTESNKIPEEQTEETNEIPESGTEAGVKIPETTQTESSGDRSTEAISEEGSGEEPHEGSGATELPVPDITIAPQEVGTSKVEPQEHEGTTKAGIPEATQEQEGTTKAGIPEDTSAEITAYPPGETQTVPTEAKLPETTEYPEQAALPEREIPGEGSCLVDGQTYKNNSAVPPINHCQTSCKCVSSILRCESIECTPPPPELQNCLPIFNTPDSCCPTYSCAGTETTPLEAASHTASTTPLSIIEEITTAKSAEELPATGTTAFATPESESTRPQETVTEPSEVTEKPLIKATEPPSLEEATRGAKPEEESTEKTEPSVSQLPEHITEVPQQAEEEKLTKPAPVEEEQEITTVRSVIDQKITEIPSGEEGLDITTSLIEDITEPPSTEEAEKEVTQIAIVEKKKLFTTVSSVQEESGVSTVSSIKEEVTATEVPVQESGLTTAAPISEIAEDITTPKEKILEIESALPTEQPKPELTTVEKSENEGAVTTIIPKEEEKEGEPVATEKPALKPTDIPEIVTEVQQTEKAPEVTTQSQVIESETVVSEITTEQPEKEVVVTEAEEKEPQEGVTTIPRISEISTEEATETAIPEEPSKEGTPQISEPSDKEKPEAVIPAVIKEGTERPLQPEKEPPKGIEEDVVTTAVPISEEPIEHVTIPEKEYPTRKPIESESHVTMQEPTEVSTEIPSKEETIHPVVAAPGEVTEKPQTVVTEELEITEKTLVTSEAAAGEPSQPVTEPSLVTELPASVTTLKAQEEPISIPEEIPGKETITEEAGTRLPGVEPTEEIKTEKTPVTIKAFETTEIPSLVETELPAVETKTTTAVPKEVPKDKGVTVVTPQAEGETALISTEKSVDKGKLPESESEAPEISTEAQEGSTETLPEVQTALPEVKPSVSEEGTTKKDEESVTSETLPEVHTAIPEITTVISEAVTEKGEETVTAGRVPEVSTAIPGISGEVTEKAEEAVTTEELPEAPITISGVTPSVSEEETKTAEEAETTEKLPKVTPGISKEEVTKKGEETSTSENLPEIETTVPEVSEGESEEEVTKKIEEIVTTERLPESIIPEEESTKKPEEVVTTERLPETETTIPEDVKEVTKQPEEVSTERLFEVTTQPEIIPELETKLPEEGVTVHQQPSGVTEDQKESSTEIGQQPTTAIPEEELKTTVPAAPQETPSGAYDEEAKTTVPAEEVPKETDKIRPTEKPISETEKTGVPEEGGETPATEKPAVEVTRRPDEGTPAVALPEITTALTIEPAENISVPVRTGELFTSGPEVETTTKKYVPGELSTSAPISEATTILPATTSSELPPSHVPGEQVTEPEYDAQNEDYEEPNAFGPGTCRYGGKVYVSAQQIPREDPCDFCFCFRSDIICLQQSCPPPIPRCHEEPIRGFCCPRYECPVSMAVAVNVTTSTTTTTTTLPPHFLSHAYKGRAKKTGCQISGKAYNVGDTIKSTSGPCLHCECGGDGQMKCDPKPCSPEPMLRQMIAAAALRRRR